MSFTSTRRVPFDYSNKSMTYEQNQALPPVTKTEFVGSTLFTFSKTYQIMSDVWEDYMTVSVIDENGNNREICLENGDTVTIDHTPEAFDRYEAKQYEIQLDSERGNAENVTRQWRKGHIAHVVKGRTGNGAVGKVIALIESSYAYSPWSSSPSTKLGIATSDRMGMVTAKNGKQYNNYLDVVWVHSRNAEIVNPSAPDYAFAEIRARQTAHDMRVHLERRTAERAKYDRKAA